MEADHPLSNSVTSRGWTIDGLPSLRGVPRLRTIYPTEGSFVNASEAKICDYAHCFANGDT